MSWLNKLWSGADFWQKEENEQQKQQFAAQTRAKQQAPRPVAQTRPAPQQRSINDNTPGFQWTNNSLTRGLSRGFDQLNPLDNNRTWQQRTPTNTLSLAEEAKQKFNTPNRPAQYWDNGIGKAVNTGIAGTMRAAAGIGQDAGGLVDLLTPGHGVNRVTKYYKDRGAMWDEKAKEAGVDGKGYHVAQAPLNILSYATPGAVLKGASAIPKVAKTAAVVSNIANKAPGVAKATGYVDDLVANGNRLQRVGGKMLQSYRQPGAMTDVVFDALQNAGHRTSLGQDNSAGTAAIDAGLSLGMQGGVNLLGQAAKPVIQTTTRLAGNVKKAGATALNNVAPYQTTTRLVQNATRLPLQTTDTLKAYSDLLVGAGDVVPGSSVHNGLIRNIRQIGNELGVDLTNGSPADKLQRIESILNGYLPQQQTSRRLRVQSLNEGGYVKNPFYRGDDVAGGKNVDPLESLKQEARKYKSAEEFVKAQGEPVYHGSNKRIKDLPKLSTQPETNDMMGKAFYVTDSKNHGGYYARRKNGNIVNELVPTKGANIVGFDDSVSNKLRNEQSLPVWVKTNRDAYNYLKVDKGIDDPNTIFAKSGVDGFTQRLSKYDPNNQLLKEQGDSLYTAIINPKKLQTKAQLTDLYNQALKESQPKARPEDVPSYVPDDKIDAYLKSDDYIRDQEFKRMANETKSGDPFDHPDMYENPTPEIRKNLKATQPTKGARASSASQAKQTVRSSAPTEPSVSSRKTVSNQPQAAGTPQNAPQDNATSKAKQASQLKAKETGTTRSVEKTTKARSQTTKATEQQSSQTKLAKRGEQELPVSYPDNTTNVVNKRGFTQSVKRSGEVSPTTQKNVSGEYNVRSTAKLAISADEFSKGNINKVTKEVNSRLDVPTGKINDQDIADSIAVAKRLDAKGDFEQATQIYDKLAEHGTKGGQAIQAFSLLKNRSPDGLKFQAVKQLKKNGVKLTPADEKKLGTLIDGVRNTKPGSEARDRAIYNTFDFVSRKLPTSTPDKLVNLWRAGLLTAPRTTGGNILGNTTEALTREFWTNPVAVTTDKFFSLFTGKRTKTMAGGRAAGAKEGVARGIDYLKTGFDPRNTPNMKYDAPRRLNYKNKVVDTYVNGVYRWMGGQDQPFYYAAKAAAARDLAKADGINLGYKGKQLAEYVEKSVFDENWKPQTFKTAKDATEYGKYAVYQNETLLGSMAAGLKRGAKSKSKGGGALADFILPFTQVPSSVAMRIVDRTPIGMAKEVVSQIKNKSFDQRAMSEAIANGSFGIPVLGAGYALANSGLITGAYPTDSKERKLWEAEGKQPYSVRIGDKWYSLNYMQPFGTVLSMGKQVSDDIKEGKSQAEAWMNATAAAAKSIESQSFLQGINGLLSAVHDPQRSMQQYANSTVSGIVPNFIRAGAMAIDPNQRETKNVGDALKGAIPGVRQTLNTKLDMFGNDLPARDTPLNQYLNPLRPSKVRNQDDPLVGELRRLQNTDNGIIPTQFNRKSIGGVDLSNEQVRELNQKVNNAVQQVWGQAINDPRYNAMDDGEKKRTLDKLKDQIAENAKAQFVTDNGIQTTSKYNSKPVTFPSSSNSRTTYKEKYDNLIAEFNDPNNGWSDVTKAKKSKELRKLTIQKDYDEDTVDLYGMSKADMYSFVSKAKNGAELEKKLLAYDKALYDAGLTSYRKYKNGIAPASRGGRKSSGGRKSRLAFEPFKFGKKSSHLNKELRALIEAAGAPSKAFPKAKKTPNYS